MQGDAVLGMALRRLTSLEAGKLQEEADALMATIRGLEQLLNNEQLVLETVKRESQEIADKFGDERRTTVSSPPSPRWHNLERCPLFPLCISWRLLGSVSPRSGGCHGRQLHCCAETACQYRMQAPDSASCLSVQIRAGESGTLSEEDIVPNRPSVLVFSRKGYVKRMPADLFATQVSAYKNC